MKKYITTLLAAAFATLALAGCSTIEGIGQDFKKAGTAIKDATKSN